MPTGLRGRLTLARPENTATTPEPVDPAAALLERAAIWEPFAAEQHVVLAVTGPAVDQVRPIPVALEQIIDNLLADTLRAAVLAPHAEPGDVMSVCGCCSSCQSSSNRACGVARCHTPRVASRRVV